MCHKGSSVDCLIPVLHSLDGIYRHSMAVTSGMYTVNNSVILLSTEVVVIIIIIIIIIDSSYRVPCINKNWVDKYNMCTDSI